MLIWVADLSSALTTFFKDKSHKEVAKHHKSKFFLLFFLDDGAGSGSARSKNIRISSTVSSLGRYVFGSEISYNKAPPRLPGLGC
jgi:hypothetical protein